MERKSGGAKERSNQRAVEPERRGSTRRGLGSNATHVTERSAVGNGTKPFAVRHASAVPGGRGAAGGVPERAASSPRLAALEEARPAGADAHQLSSEQAVLRASRLGRMGRGRVFVRLRSPFATLERAATLRSGWSGCAPQRRWWPARAAGHLGRRMTFAQGGRRSAGDRAQHAHARAPERARACGGSAGTVGPACRAQRQPSTRVAQTFRKGRRAL